MKICKTELRYKNLPLIEGVAPNGCKYKFTDKHWKWCRNCTQTNIKKEVLGLDKIEEKTGIEIPII